MGLGGSSRKVSIRLVIGRSSVRIRPRAPKLQVRGQFWRYRLGGSNRRSFLWLNVRAGAHPPRFAMEESVWLIEHPSWASFVGPRRAELWKTDDWAGPAGRARFAQSQKNQAAASPPNHNSRRAMDGAIQGMPKGTAPSGG